MLEVFYDFCRQRRYTGCVMIEENGAIVFRIERGKCASAYRLAADDVQHCKDLPGLTRHVTRWLEIIFKRTEACASE